MGNRNYFHHNCATSYHCIPCKEKFKCKNKTLSKKGKHFCDHLSELIIKIINNFL